MLGQSWYIMYIKVYNVFADKTQDLISARVLGLLIMYFNIHSK